MALLIDGYNLLHVTGIVGRRGSGLQGSREALLRFLATAIDAAERPRTTIVFDAAEAPPGLPRTVAYEGMTIRYASEYPDADALLEELIAADHVPKSLTVVSSDHRVQRAARRRRAAFVDSDVWFAEAVRRRARRAEPAPAATRVVGPLSEAEVNYWLAEFGGRRSLAESDSASKPASGAPRDASCSSPFPPGYGEDLLKDG